MARPKGPEKVQVMIRLTKGCAGYLATKAKRQDESLSTYVARQLERSVPKVEPFPKAVEPRFKK